MEAERRQVASETLAKEVGLAGRNFIKLGLSLIGTWTVTLLVRGSALQA